MNNFKILILLIIVTFFALSSFAQDKSKSKKLDAMIEKGIKEWQIPGLTAIVVKDGEIVFNKVYGIKDIESKEPVDDNTLFNMGSTTKALIAISIGMLVDQGKINWEDKVRKHLPTFNLSDQYIAADARIKDLLTHNLGIGNADLLWVIDSTSTTETINKFKYAKKTYPLRGGFTYQNIMYAIAGEVIEAISGQHWTTFVTSNIFKPLKMNRSQAKSINILKAGNYTTPHNIDLKDGLVKVDHTFSDQIGAAGMVWSSTKDIGNYLKFLINDGIFNGDTLVQPSTFKYLFKPHVIIPQEMYPTQRLTKPEWMTYGLGWFQHDYRGSKLDFHTGSLPGLIAIAGVIHEYDVAVYVFANLDHAELRHAIMYKAIDLYVFNDNSRNWHQETFKLYKGLRKKSIEAIKKRDKKRVLKTSPSLALKEYTGTYLHEMLGNIHVSIVEQQLYLNFNNYLSYKTQHWHYNTFITNKDSKYLDKLLVNFNLNQNGKIKELNVLGVTFIKKRRTF
jgi:CubicO group peptidase (beta-lactamase class C family)